ncbi:MAG: BlaI/MecI/CopY family transcriptional regulator [Oscillospiraceae bacterium]|nr:BlaI/MecI/CopY family transcriptional regulator [Oscillospiraceae bacterium]
MHLTEAERKVMEVLWEQDNMTAKDIAVELKNRVGWSKTTSYTMLSRCEGKRLLHRQEPAYRCSAAITREQAAEWETDELLQNNYHGSADVLVAALVGQKKLSLKQLKKLYQQLSELEAAAE